MSLMPVDGDRALITNAAVSARERRKHNSTPRIRHWLDEVMEHALRLSPRKTQSGAEAEPKLNFEQSPKTSPRLSPSMSYLLEFKDAIAHFGDFRLSDNLSQDSSSALRSKPSLESLGSNSDCGTQPTSESSFGDLDAKGLRTLPGLLPKIPTREETISERRHTATLAVKVVQPPFRTRYTLEKHARSKSAGNKECLREQTVKRPTTMDHIYGFPYLQADTASVPALIPETPDSPVSDGPHPLDLLTPSTPTITAATPTPTPAPPPEAPALTTSRGAELASLPPLPDNLNALRLTSARMAKKSERMLEAAVAIRAQQARGITILGPSTALQRRVLEQAYGSAQAGPAPRSALARGAAGRGGKKTVSFADDDAEEARLSGSETSWLSSCSESSGRSVGSAGMRHRLSFVPSGKVQRKG